MLLTSKPAFLIVQNKLLRFYDFVDGNKLNTFINRKYVVIRKEQERDYYDQFVCKLLEKSPVYAQGLEIKDATMEAKAILHCPAPSDPWRLQLKFIYGGDTFDYQEDKKFHISIRWEGDDPVITKIRRSRQWEDNRLAELTALGLVWKNENNLILPRQNRA